MNGKGMKNMWVNIYFVFFASACKTISCRAL